MLGPPSPNFGRGDGPPILKPYWLRLRKALVGLKNGRDENFELRLYSKMLPWNSLWPRSVTTLTWEAPYPSAASAFEVVTVNWLMSSTPGRWGAKSVAFERMKLSWMLMPSRVMLVNEVRWPLMAVLVAPLEAEPACRVSRTNGLRPLSGSSWICRELTVLLSSAVVALSTSAPATTVTFSLTPPGSKVIAREYGLPTSILRSVALKVLKPWAVTLTV